jgi:uncharacterized protein YcbX
VDAEGRVLGQKSCPQLCLLQPSIDWSRGVLTLRAPGAHGSIDVALDGDESGDLAPDGSAAVTARVRGTARAGAVHSPARVHEWLSQWLGRAVTLVRQRPPTRVRADTEGRVLGAPSLDAAVRELSASCAGDADGAPAVPADGPSGFANTGQFLVVSRASVAHVSSLVGGSAAVDASRFRANVVLAGGADALPPHAEDAADALVIAPGTQRAQVLRAHQLCNRCTMVNIDQASGASDAHGEPLLTLSAYRRDAGRVLFGALMSHVPAESAALRLVAVGDEVLLRRRAAAAADAGAGVAPRP